MTKRRCAIYTRKSTEEGLDQDFNSLDAQREACTAYIRSQAGEGWIANKDIYDDGGFSGGSMNRPALQRLLADIAARRVDIVVVYKVDRLTRSLADFSKIVELLDAHDVSFVSVTQAFSTTSSMGRLTLNILLSFAQFEREMTGERIRDKVAASKARGIFMGGAPPLGYDIGDRALVVNETESALVRRIYERYVALKAIAPVVRELNADGARTKQWISRAGRAIGGAPFRYGAVNHILTARVYRGEIAHKGKIHRGAHDAIIDPELWDQAAAQLRANAAPAAPAPKIGESHFLVGLIEDDVGNAMSPTHATKQGRRYRYYCSAALLQNRSGAPGEVRRLPAMQVDQSVLQAVSERLHPTWRADDALEVRVRAALIKVKALPDGLVAHIHREAVDGQDASLEDADDAPIVVKTSTPLRRRGANWIVEPHGVDRTPVKIDAALVRAIINARRWTEKLGAGEVQSVRAIAKTEGICHLYVGKLLPLAFLAPDLVDLVLRGRQPRGLTISSFLAKPLPLTWSAQRARFLAAG